MTGDPSSVGSPRSADRAVRGECWWRQLPEPQSVAALTGSVNVDGPPAMTASITKTPEDPQNKPLIARTVAFWISNRQTMRCSSDDAAHNGTRDTGRPDPRCSSSRESGPR